jgi:DNA topoisomerase IA
VGYKVSPLLWQLPNVGKSAGRVQTCALRLVCELEEKIQAFKVEDYWSVTAEYQEGFTASYFGTANDPSTPSPDTRTADVPLTILREPQNTRSTEETSEDAIDSREVKKPESKKVRAWFKKSRFWVTLHSKFDHHCNDDPSKNSVLRLSSMEALKT